MTPIRIGTCSFADEALTKVFYPEASATVIFIIMAIVLLVRPAGLFGTQK